MPQPISNPPNPWSTSHVEWLGEPPPALLEVYEERTRSVLSRNESPDIPFRYSVNPYRGCFHGCAYCYARPSHQFLGWGAGTDFERRIVVKVDVPESLSLELARPSLRGERIAFSGVTDCYQPLEASYGLTRRCLQVCLARGNAVGIITKAALVRRDVDVLARLAAGPGASVYFSVPFADPRAARSLEPYVPSPARRFEAMRALSDAGIQTGLALAPLIPGLSDSDVPKLLEMAARAGAKSAFLVLLRLPGEVELVFRQRLAEAYPERAAKVLGALREAHGGRLYDSRFGARMTGTGPRWQATVDLFEMHCRRLGLDSGEGPSPRPGSGEGGAGSTAAVSTARAGTAAPSTARTGSAGGSSAEGSTVRAGTARESTARESTAPEGTGWSTGRGRARRAGDPPAHQPGLFDPPP
jgi:DNA repair photolyase